MEFESTDNIAMVYETLKNINIAIMGVRDIIAHHYFEVDPDAVFDIIKNDLEPLKKAIQFFKDQLFPEAKTIL